MLTNGIKYSWTIYRSMYMYYINNNNNNSEALLGANIHRPDVPLASQEREESENQEGRGKNYLMSINVTF